MKRILIVYASKTGQTKKIAHAIADELESLEYAVYLSEAAKIAETNHIQDYDGILVGAPVLAGSYSKPLKKWAKSKALILNQKPTAFFSVCLGILQKNDEKVQKEVYQFPRDLFDATGWHPNFWTVLAGALPYT
ncbi:MAG: flavodoxin domain-containing protein, partial [Bdellovibrionia bacterium]